MLAQLVDGDRPEHAQQVRNLLGGTSPARGIGALELGMDLGDDLRIEQLAQLYRAEQLGQKRWVEG